MYNPAGNRPHQRGSLSIFFSKDVMVWPAYGGCSSADGRLVLDSFHSRQKVEAGLRQNVFKRFPISKIDTTFATLGHFNRNYYHRFVDSIPRIYALWHPELRAESVIVLLIDERFTAEELNLIRFLVPSNVSVRRVRFTTRVQPARYCHLPFLGNDRVGYSKWFFESAGFLPVEYVQWFRERVFKFFGVDGIRPWRRIFVTRRSARVRKIKNEKQIRAALSSKGFETVELEKLSLSEQVKTFAEARCVVAQHGAGLTNILYMHSGSRVIELMSTPDRLIHYSLLSENVGLEHVQIFHDESTKNDDIRVDVNKLILEISFY